MLDCYDGTYVLTELWRADQDRSGPRVVQSDPELLPRERGVPDGPRTRCMSLVDTVCWYQARYSGIRSALCMRVFTSVQKVSGQHGDPASDFIEGRYPAGAVSIKFAAEL